MRTRSSQSELDPGSDNIRMHFNDSDLNSDRSKNDSEEDAASDASSFYWNYTEHVQNIGNIQYYSLAAHR